MRDPVPLQAFVAAVEARKRALGVTDAEILAARNDGGRRTPAKRAMLARIRARARAAGKDPLPAAL